jgi:hypothetical protein
VSASAVWFERQFAAHKRKTVINVKSVVKENNVVNILITGGAGYKGVILAMNFSKLELARVIQSFLHNEIIETQLADPDRRDFIINFEKITALGFKPTITIADGIDELIRLYSWYQPYQNYRPI